MSVVVVGGGIIGLSVAWRAAQAGHRVSVVDPEPGSGASRAAAGMLAPVSEAHYGEEALLELNLASHRRWPAFAAELSEASGLDVPLRREGSLQVAFDADDLRALEDLRAFQEELGLGVARMRGRECRELEPLLSPRIRGGIRADHEANVDGRVACRALLRAAAGEGVELVRDEVTEVSTRGDGSVDGVRTAGGGSHPADQVVVAAGCWSGSLGGIPPEAAPPVRPVKGQIIRLRFDPAEPPLARNVRALARGWSVYLVPRASGELVVGATVEEQGFDTAVTAGGLHELLRAAIEVLPVAAELELVESIARLRPATPDNAPVIGPTPVPGLVMATGHHRNGILLAPLTAEAVAGVLADGAAPPEVLAFGIGRFHR